MSGGTVVKGFRKEKKEIVILMMGLKFKSFDRSY